MISTEFLLTSLVVVLIPGTGVIYTVSNGLFLGWRASIAVKGFLINILNPKLSIFFLAFLPLFVSPEAASPVFQLLTLSLIFMGLTLVVFILYGLSANGVRKYITHSPQVITWIQRSFAATFAALGFKLATTER